MCRHRFAARGLSVRAALRHILVALPLAVPTTAFAQSEQGQSEIKITGSATTIDQSQDEVWEVLPYTHATSQIKLTELSLTGSSDLHFYFQTSNTLSDQDWMPMDTLSVPATAPMPQVEIVELSLDSPNPRGRYLRWQAEFLDAASSQYVDHIKSVDPSNKKVWVLHGGLGTMPEFPRDGLSLFQSREVGGGRLEVETLVPGAASRAIDMLGQAEGGDDGLSDMRFVVRRPEGDRRNRESRLGLFKLGGKLYHNIDELCAQDHGNNRPGNWRLEIYYGGVPRPGVNVAAERHFLNLLAVTETDQEIVLEESKGETIDTPSSLGVVFADRAFVVSRERGHLLCYSYDPRISVGYPLTHARNLVVVPPRAPCVIELRSRRAAPLLLAGATPRSKTRATTTPLREDRGNVHH